MSTTSAPLPPRHPASLHGNDQATVERRTLRDYFIILRERLWIALPAALLVSLALGYYQARDTPMYSSTATMQFERPERIVISEQVVDPSIRSDADLGNYLQILNSARLQSMVAQSLTADEVRTLQRPYLKNLAPGTALPSGTALLGRTVIEAVRNSFLIKVTVQNRDSEGAALVANRYIEQFVRYLIENVGGKNEFAVDYLKSRAEELRKESDVAETRLQDYKREHNLVSLSASVDIVAERLKTINSALTTVRLDRLNLEVQRKQIEKIKAEGGNLLEVSSIATYGNMPALTTQLEELKKQKSIYSDRYLERHPKMIDLTNAIDVVTQQISSNIEQAVDELTTQYNKTVQSEQSYEHEYHEAEKAQLHLGDLSVEFKSLENQAAVAKSNYIQILDRLNQTTTSKNLENIPVKPLDRATPAGGPYTPNIPAIIKISVWVFLLVFVLVAVGLSFLDDRVKSAWDVESFIGAHLLGIIPELGHIPDTERPTLAGSDKTSPGAEAFLSVYSSVKIQSKLDFPKSLLITSTIPGEGKTMISSNLAAAFARHGKKVLLIDCDLRRPTLHRQFQLANDTGLITWFEAGAAISSAPLTDPTLGITQVDANLFLLRAGGHSKGPTELLENPAFTQFIASLKRHFDLVVVDSPPMGAVTDALLLAGVCDEVIYVCRFNRAYRKHIRLYIKQLKDSRNELLGVVLNGLSPRRIEYYSNYRYYRSYKKYYGSHS
jgi:polysaccharide biosynthesis transport protein